MERNEWRVPPEKGPDQINPETALPAGYHSACPRRSFKENGPELYAG